MKRGEKQVDKLDDFVMNITAEEFYKDEHDWEEIFMDIDSES